MYNQCIVSSVVAAQLASKYLSKKKGSLLVLSGSAAALDPTPGMLGYGLTKAAVHHLTKSLAQPKSGLPPDASVLAILPTTLDTPSNRASMPNADTSSWTPMQHVVGEMKKWLEHPITRPASGSLVKITTSNSKSCFTVVGAPDEPTDD